MEGGQQNRSLYSPTDTTFSRMMVHQAQGQQLFVCAGLTAIIPSQEEQGEPWRLGLLPSPAANRQPGPRH